MSDRRVIQVGVSSIPAMADRFVDTWERTARGENVRPHAGVSFEDFETMLTTLTPRRWELLRELRRRGPMTIYALARALGRHYKNVHNDVKRLAELDLVVRGPNYVEVPWDEIEAHISLAA